MSAYLLFTETLVDSDTVDFGVTDERGRSVGYATFIYQRTYTARTDGNTWGTKPQNIHQDGAVIFRGATTVTRNGDMFGAAHPDFFTETQAEAKDAVVQRMEGARKRYTKNAGRVANV